MRQSNEGELRWFSIGAIPYEEMWEDDRVWLPLLLDGKSFVGNFYFSANYKEFLSHETYETTRLQCERV
jgi:8-oxo-dGTP diphosphatase